MTQTNMFESDMDTKFAKFHADNPQVYSILLRLTRQAKERGKRKIGIGMLFEVMRWEMFLRTTDEDFKLNNNYRSRYARKIMAENPELDGIFETRELHT